MLALGPSPDRRSYGIVGGRFSVRSGLWTARGGVTRSVPAAAVCASDSSCLSS